MPLGDSPTATIFERTATQARASDVIPTTGMRRETFADVATGIRCTIQMRTSEVKTGIEGDDTPAAKWLIYVEAAFAGTFQPNDRLTDDLGRQFRVKIAYPTPLGWQLLAADWDALSS